MSNDKPESEARSRTCKNSGGAPCYAHIRHTEDEWKTVMSALHHYGHNCMNAFTGMSQVGFFSPDGKPYTKEQIDDAKTSADRAFSIIERMRRIEDRA